MDISNPYSIVIQYQCFLSVHMMKPSQNVLFLDLAIGISVMRALANVGLQCITGEELSMKFLETRCWIEYHRQLLLYHRLYFVEV